MDHTSLDAVEFAARSIATVQQAEQAIRRLRAVLDEPRTTEMLERVRVSRGVDPVLLIEQYVALAKIIAPVNDLCRYVERHDLWRVVRPETIRRCASLTATR